MDNFNLFSKKIILHGESKIKKDFKYLFRELNIEKEDISEDIYLHKEDFIIILCKKDRDVRFDEWAGRSGLDYGRDYIYIKDFFLYYNPMFLSRGNRQLAVWGTGACAGELWDALEDRGIAAEIDFYIDNSADKAVFKGKQVLSPIEIKDRRDLYIIVATRDYQWEIYRQLDEYGFVRKKDYVHYGVVSMDYGRLLEQVCFTEKRYSHVCHRPFGYCDLIGEDLYLCCPDFLPLSAGSMRSETFMECWDSYMARILRLSVCNGTFVFCNEQYCDLFDFDEDPQFVSRQETDYGTMHSEYPQTLMVGIDHSCNLKCPSCRQEICVATADQRKEMDRQTEDLLEHVIPYVNRLWMAGSGEVFFSQSYQKILNDKRCKERSSISILSNGTLFDEEKWRLLEESYEAIEVVISMDGIKDSTIERLRRGADAKKLKRHLEFLGEQRKKGKLQRLFLSCVLQADNIAELYDLLEYCKDIGIDKVQFLKLKNNGIYIDDSRQFDKMSLFGEDDRLKEEYLHYFTEDLVQHPLADWFNNTRALQVEKKPRLDNYDTF